jgi:hypothetical protein
MLLLGDRPVRYRILAPLVLILAILPIVVTPAADPPGEEQARAAAQRFGQALQKGDASILGSVLPEKGKVLLRLDLLGPGEGYFSPNQVEALLREFFAHGTIQSFKLLRVEHDAQSYALANGRVELTDRAGRPARIELHLAFQAEDGRWVLREIRETRP